MFVNQINFTGSGVKKMHIRIIPTSENNKNNRFLYNQVADITKGLHVPVEYKTPQIDIKFEDRFLQSKNIEKLIDRLKAKTIEYEVMN